MKAEELLGESVSTVEHFLILVEKGFLTLARKKSAAPIVEQIKAIFSQEDFRTFIDYKKLVYLEQAQQAYDQEKNHLLYRGQLISDISPALQQWLAKTGRLKPRPPGSNPTS